MVLCSSYNSCDAPCMTKEYILNVITMLSNICISNYEYLVLHNICEEFEDTKGMHVEPSWALSYGRWIYNYLCMQCISPLKLWVRISVMAKCTRYNNRWYSLSVTCHTSMFFFRVLRFPPLIHKTEILFKAALSTINQKRESSLRQGINRLWLRPIYLTGLFTDVQLATILHLIHMMSEGVLYS